MLFPRQLDGIRLWQGTQNSCTLSPPFYTDVASNQENRPTTQDLYFQRTTVENYSLQRQKNYNIK